MIDDLKSYGMRLMVSVWPHVAENSENFLLMYKEGLLTDDSNGSVLSATDLVTNVSLYISDPSNTATRQYV